MGDEALDVYNAFTWDSEEDKVKMDKVLEKFEHFCEPQKNTIYERYLFFSEDKRLASQLINMSQFYEIWLITANLKIKEIH